MKLFVILGFCALVATQMVAQCYYIPCDGVVQSSKSQVNQAITKAYEELFGELDELKNRYSEQLRLLKAQNSLLARQKALLIHSTSTSKKVSFIMSKFNQLQSNKNSTKAQKSNNRSINENISTSINDF